MVDSLTNTNSTNDKIRILRQFEDIQEFIRMIWDPGYTTGVTRRTIERTIDRHPPSEVLPILELLRGLYTRRLSGGQAQSAIHALVVHHPAHADLILRIVDKNLKARVTHKIVNRAFPGLIPDFSVSLGTDKAKSGSFFAQHPDSWYVSRKFDGVRCIVRVDGLQTTCFSRNGHALPSLEHLAHTAGRLFPPGTILDGEVCVVDENNLECFTAAVSRIKRKHEIFTNFRFYIFDYLTHAEFDTRTSTRFFLDRQRALAGVSYTDDRIRIVQHRQYTAALFAEMEALAAARGWEGLILRRDAPYRGMRSNDVLKHKRFNTQDYRVTGVVHSTMRVLDEETGMEVEEEMLRSVTILHRGEIVHVGSGFTQRQRRDYYRQPDTIIGQLIEVQYFEECSDGTGKVSLRFPTLKQVYNST